MLTGSWAGAQDTPVAELVESYSITPLSGFDVLVHHDLLDRAETWSRVRVHLEADLDEVIHRLPPHAVERLRSTRVWVELQGRVVPGGMSGRGKYFHPSAEWLGRHGVLVDKAGGIEIANAEDFLNWRANQPYGLLHEFAHAWWYHLPASRRAPVEAAYREAMSKGLYDAVGYNLAPAGEKRRAYAASSASEYFAELSEAWFALNDYEPMTRVQLVSHDPTGAAVIEQAWQPFDEEAERDGALGR